MYSDLNSAIADAAEFAAESALYAAIADGLNPLDVRVGYRMAMVVYGTLTSAGESSDRALYFAELYSAAE
jgi:hypothetical protein